MLKLIALTTLVVFPILLLLLLQIQFLPFHDVAITNAQRAALFLDIVLLWLLRPPILADLGVDGAERSLLFAGGLRALGLGLAVVMSLLALWFSTVVATIPGEWPETALARLDRSQWRFADVAAVSTHGLLFAGQVDETTRRRKSLFSNTLVLPGFNLYEALKIDDPKKLAWKEHLFDLRARHLEQAVFNGADVTKADLAGAQLQGASLFGAKLQGASLYSGRLQGAWLDQAQLQGASLAGAQLQGADFWRAQLQGASLYGAELQGASLREAQLQDAALAGAQLQCALLEIAQLQGASLQFAQLQGALLDAADVNATNFSNAFLWRTNWGEIDQAKLGAIRLDAALERWKPVWQFGPWDAKAYAELRVSMNSVPEGLMRDKALKRIETLGCGNQTRVWPHAIPPPRRRPKF